MSGQDDELDRRMRAAYDHLAADFAAVNAAMPPELAACGARFLALNGGAPARRTPRLGG